MLRDFVLFQDKLLDAFEEIIDAWDTYKDYLDGFYAAYDFRRHLPWLSESQHGLGAALSGVLSGFHMDPLGKITDSDVKKLTPPPDFALTLFTTFENLLQTKPIITYFVAHFIHSTKKFPDLDDITVADLKNILLRCFEVYVVRTSHGVGISLGPW